MNQRVILFGIVALLVLGTISALVSRSGQSNTNDTEISSMEGVTNNQNPIDQNSQTTMKQYDKFPGLLQVDQLSNKKAVIETDKGVIEFEILPEAPMAASNFIFLAGDGFYDGLNFHRVVPGFVIQGGDPVGNGTGGPGYQFADEQVTRKYDQGIVAMANSGPDTNGSQFFIMLENNQLPPSYTIFGKVIKGQDVVDQIRVGDKMNKVSIQNIK
jgi:cyclophilin family peptidyl-prolyl cis-trans isomerase